MNERPDNHQRDSDDESREPGEFRPDFRIAHDDETNASVQDPDDLRNAGDQGRDLSWRDAIDGEVQWDSSDGAVPPDESDWNREEGDDYGARWFAGAGRLLVILALLGLLVPLFAVIFGNPASSTTIVRESPARVRARVLDVINGNTITVQIQGRNSTVRLIGVDIPAPNDEFHGLANQVMNRWVNGRFVQLEADDQDADPEGRLLRYVWVDNAMVNAALIASGLARSVDRSPNDRYSDTFTAIEENARSDGLGMWDTGGRGA